MDRLTEKCLDVAEIVSLRDEIARLTAALDAMRKERDGLAKALRPFAEHADALDDRYAAWSDSAPAWNVRGGLTIGDCRRARKALSAPPASNPKEPGHE